MTSEKITFYRSNEDKTELIEQLPKTVASQVYDSDNEQFLHETLIELTDHNKNDTDKKHIKVASSVPTDLSETGILFKVDGSQSDVPGMVTVDTLNENVLAVAEQLEQLEHVGTQLNEDIYDLVPVNNGVNELSVVRDSFVKWDFEGKHLLNYAPGFNSDLWNFHENVSIVSPTKIILNATGNYQESYVSFDAKENQVYTLTCLNPNEAELKIKFYDATGTQIGSNRFNNTARLTTTSPIGTISMGIFLGSASKGAGVYVFENVQVFTYSGTQEIVYGISPIKNATLINQNTNGAMLSKETIAENFYGNSTIKDKLIESENGKLYKEQRWKETSLNLFSWVLHRTESTYKVIRTNLTDAVNNSSIIQHSNSLLLVDVATESNINAVNRHCLINNVLYVSIPVSQTDFSSYFANNNYKLVYATTTSSLKELRKDLLLKLNAGTNHVKLTQNDFSPNVTSANLKLSKSIGTSVKMTLETQFSALDQFEKIANLLNIHYGVNALDYCPLIIPSVNTYDGSELQKLLDNNKRVYLAEGTFLTNGLKLNKYNALIGAGKYLTRLKLKDGSRNVNVIQNKNNASSFNTVRDLTIDGNKANTIVDIVENVENYGNGIYWYRTTRQFENDCHNVFENLYVGNCYRDGLYIRALSGDGKFKNLTIRNNGNYGIHVDAPDDFYSDIVSYGNGNSGIRLSVGSTQWTNIKAYFNGSTTERVPNIWVEKIDYSRKAQNILFNNVFSQDAYGHGFLIKNVTNMIFSSCSSSRSGMSGNDVEGSHEYDDFYFENCTAIIGDLTASDWTYQINGLRNSRYGVNLNNVSGYSLNVTVTDRLSESSQINKVNSSSGKLLLNGMET